MSSDRIDTAELNSSFTICTLVGVVVFSEASVMKGAPIILLAHSHQQVEIFFWLITGRQWQWLVEAKIVDLLSHVVDLFAHVVEFSASIAIAGSCFASITVETRSQIANTYHAKFKRG